MSAVEGVSIRPYLDNNIDLWIASDLRSRGFESVHSLETGNERLTDEGYLRWATDHQHTIVTFDRKDFQLLAEQWNARGAEHAGIIITISLPRLPISEMHRRLLAFLNQVSADEMRNRLRWLDAQWSAPDRP